MIHLLIFTFSIYKQKKEESSEEEESPKKKKTTKKKSKKKKDPNAPKRALSAYMYFSMEQRPKVKEEDPSLKFGDIGNKTTRIIK